MQTIQGLNPDAERVCDMALLFYSDDDDLAQWRDGLLPHLPDLDMRGIANIGDKAEIDMALVWKPPQGLLAELPNLGVVFSLAAGVDALLADPTLPDVPLCRMIDPSLTRGMSEYILYHCLRYYRRFDLFERQQARALWSLELPPPADEFRIGILGLGELGLDAAATLKRFDFQLSGWSRTAKSIEGISCYCGADGLSQLLHESDVVICLVPLTAETTGMLDAGFFASMQPGSRLIHVGRGRQLIEDDLLDAVDRGHLAGAVVDVTPVEPLAAGSRLWRHPRIVVTPHAASYVQPKTGAANLAANIKRFYAGQPLCGVVDRVRGY